MGHESTMSFEQKKFEKIQTKEQLYELLDEQDICFLENQYEDLTIEQGFMNLSYWNRKNYDAHKWKEILLKIAKFEGKEIAVKFEDDSVWGYKGTPEGEILELRVTAEWVAESDRRKMVKPKELTEDNNETNYMFALTRDDKQIDITNLDENDSNLAKELFYGEFGHKKQEGDKVELIETN